jgi:hypothetical protein
MFPNHWSIVFLLAKPVVCDYLERKFDVNYSNSSCKRPKFWNSGTTPHVNITLHILYCTLYALYFMPHVHAHVCTWTLYVYYKIIYIYQYMFTYCTWHGIQGIANCTCTSTQIWLNLKASCSPFLNLVTVLACFNSSPVYQPVWNHSWVYRNE